VTLVDNSEVQPTAVASRIVRIEPVVRRERMEPPHSPTEKLAAFCQHQRQEFSQTLKPRHVSVAGVQIVTGEGSMSMARSRGLRAEGLTLEDAHFAKHNL